MQLEIQAMSNGYQGAPIWDDRRRHVLGMITHIERQDGMGGMNEAIYAVPVKVLRRFHQEILRKYQSDIPVTFEQSSVFHSNEPFTEGERHLFLGYEEIIERAKVLLDNPSSLLAIVGPEKSGKTSLVQAGLISRIMDGEIENLRNYGIFKAKLSGQEPLQELARQGLEGAAQELQVPKVWSCRDGAYS